MSAAKKQNRKYTGHYPLESSETLAKGVDPAEAKIRNQADKKLIEQYISNIENLLKSDTQAQKKAAQILSAMINSKP